MAPASAATVAVAATAVNVAMNAWTAYDVGKLVYDNREKIGKWYNNLITAAEEHLSTIQNDIDSYSAMSYSSGRITGYVRIRTDLEGRELNYYGINGALTDPNEYGNYHLLTEDFFGAVYKVTPEGIEIGTWGWGYNANGNFMPDVNKKLIMAEGFNAYLAGKQEEYGQDYVDPLTAIQTDKGMNLIMNPVVNINQVWVDYSVADLAARGLIHTPGIF